MFFQKHRWQIWNQVQHPYKHNLAEFSYTNDSLPNVTNAASALNWLVSVLYPQTQPAVDTPADLPLVGNNTNDYRVVLDDGDGKAASYRWEQREGDVAPQWYKIYDMDWGEQSILSNFLLATQDVYAYKWGLDDLDETGTPYAGDLGGQRIYGGATAGTHLILYANSGDGTGPNTGFVQFGDDVRPLFDSTYTLGTDTYRFLNFYTDEANVSTMQILGGSIVDSSGAIDFATNNLSTDGTVSVGTLLLAGGSITDASGTVDFDDENITTTGSGTFNDLTALGAPSAFASGTTVGTLTLADGSITDSDGAISFGDENLSTTGSGTFGLLTVDNLQLDANTLSTIAGDLTIAPFTGELLLTGNMDISGSLTLGATNALITDIGLTSAGGYTFTASTGGFTFAPFNQEIDFTANLDPTTDGMYDLGESSLRWQDLFLSGTVSDGSVAIAISTLLSFRDATTGANAGDSLFWDNATSRFLPSAPDTEIDHGTIAGLLDDDHTQYALLAGRSGGQTLIGGTDANDNLVLDSTSDGTKGTINFLSSLSPGSDNALDLGSGASRLRDLYMGGQGIGFRFENLGALPAAGNNGRAVWLNANTLWIDDGTNWQEISSEKFIYEHVGFWDGTQTTFTYNQANSGIENACSNCRDMIWELQDNTNGFRRVDGAVITKTATTVTVTATIPLSAGTYRLVGVG
jgi:hypothetical protein